MLHSKLVTTQTSWSLSGARIPVRATSSLVIGSVERNSFLARSAVNLSRRVSASSWERIRAATHPEAASTTVFPGSVRRISSPLRFRQTQFARSRSIATKTPSFSRTMNSGVWKRPAGVIGNAIRCPSFLLERLQGLHGVDQGRSSPDDGRDVDRLGHLFPGGPRGRGSLGVDVDAVRALDRVRDREGDQFLGLLSERAFRERGGYPCVVGLEGLRRVHLEIGKGVEIRAGVKGTGHFDRRLRRKKLIPSYHNA